MAKIEFDRTGPSGNIFFIVGQCAAVLSSVDELMEMYDRVQQCGSYDEALAVIGEYVELVERRA